MERSEKLINIWNGEFPNYPLTVADLKIPRAMIGAFFQVFNKLGFDNDAILSPPPEDERDEHTMYYWDLLPIINMTRVINHVVSVLQQTDKLSITFPLTISHFLQPDATTSHSILLLLVNLMAFNENRLRDIAPYQEELFGKREQVIKLEEKKIRMLELLNEQAEEKGKRAGRMEKMEHEIMQLEEELKVEKEALDKENQELEAILEENRQRDLIINQKTGVKQGLLAEIERKKAQRVYDAEDMRANVEQAEQKVQEAEDTLNSLKEALMQRENSLINLQKLKPTLDTANKLLDDIMKLTESLKEAEMGDLESDSKEGELCVCAMEVSELQCQLAELTATRQELTARRNDSHARRQIQRATLNSAVREVEENDKRCRERMLKSQQIIQEIEQRTVQYEEERKTAVKQLESVQKDFVEELKSYEEALMAKVQATGEKIIKRVQEKRR